MSAAPNWPAGNRVMPAELADVLDSRTIRLLKFLLRHTDEPEAMLLRHAIIESATKGRPMEETLGLPTPYGPNRLERARRRDEIIRAIDDNVTGRMTGRQAANLIAGDWAAFSANLMRRGPLNHVHVALRQPFFVLYQEGLSIPALPTLLHILQRHRLRVV